MKKTLAAGVLAAALAASAAPPGQARPAYTDGRQDLTPVVAPWVHASGTGFADATGARVYLRGFDAIGYPAKAAALGANFVRMPVYWSDIEPAPPVDGRHSWDEAALAAIDDRVQAFAAQGINVLLDFHQSGWSSYFTALTVNAQGIPSWFYSSGFFPFPATQRGLGQARADFFTNPATIPYYQAFVDLLVRRYRSYPNVVGYELFNEPPSGALGQNHAATQALIEWQGAMLRFVRSLDAERTVFLFVRAGGDLGFLNADLGPLGSLANVAIDLHDYFVGLDAPYGYSADTETWYPSDAATHVQFENAYAGTYANQLRLIDRVLARTNAWNVPLLVGEWGARADDPGLLRYQQDMLGVFRARRLSWARWMLTNNSALGILDADGSYSAAALQIQADLDAPY
jgi:Cellulase (glycosyl hydrolase family 5)